MQPLHVGATLEPPRQKMPPPNPGKKKSFVRRVWLALRHRRDEKEKKNESPMYSGLDPCPLRQGGEPRCNNDPVSAREGKKGRTKFWVEKSEGAASNLWPNHWTTSKTRGRTTKSVSDQSVSKTKKREEGGRPDRLAVGSKKKGTLGGGVVARGGLERGCNRFRSLVQTPRKFVEGLVGCLDLCPFMSNKEQQLEKHGTYILDSLF